MGRDAWASGSHEPSLDELFAEPIVQLLMKRDGIHPLEMQHQLQRIAHRNAASRHF